MDDEYRPGESIFLTNAEWEFFSSLPGTVAQKVHKAVQAYLWKGPAPDPPRFQSLPEVGITLPHLGRALAFAVATATAGRFSCLLSRPLLSNGGHLLGSLEARFTHGRRRPDY